MSSPSERPAALSPLKQALLALEEMEAKLAAADGAKAEPIAIVGMGCRLPGGASDPDSFWKLLSEGADVVGEIPVDRWDADAYYDPLQWIWRTLRGRGRGSASRVELPVLQGSAPPPHGDAPPPPGDAPPPHSDAPLPPGDAPSPGEDPD
jgi:hypothetical protein